MFLDVKKCKNSWIISVLLQELEDIKNRIGTLVFLFCRIEAAKCPDVVVAQIDPRKLKKKQTVNISVSSGES